ncbi:MAG: hypothetical protein ACRDZQ_02745 [Acidimicrobiales bacterium]
MAGSNGPGGAGGRRRRKGLVRFLRVLPPLGVITAATGFASLALAQASNATPPVAIAVGALIPLGVLALIVGVPLVLVFCNEDDDGGYGGGGPPPPPPEDPDPEPPWWPSFELDLRLWEAGRDRPPVH